MQWHKPFLTLCGDRLEVDEDEEIYVYRKYVLLSITKVVSTGFKCLITDGKKEEEVNCRWDIQDTYFVSRNKNFVDFVASYSLSEARIFLAEDTMGLCYDQEAEMETIKRS